MIDLARERSRTLVTGAAGFIGTHLARRLAALGHDVVAIDIRDRPPALDVPRLSYHRVDIRDRADVEELLQGVSVLFHLASAHLEVHAPPEVYQATNVGAAEELVRACRAAGVTRLIHTSSVGIYGHVSDPPAREESPKQPKTVYERTKLAGEEAALRAAAESGQDIVVLRPAWVYGPGCPRTAKLMRSLQKRVFFYIGSGANLRHPIFIDEMIDAFLLAAGAPESASGKAYVIAGPRFVELREYVSTFARLLDLEPPRLSLPRTVALALGWCAERAFGVLRREPPFSRRSLAFFENDSAFDTVAARNDLGFNPAIDIEEGLRRTIEELTAGDRPADSRDV